MILLLLLALLGRALAAPGDVISKRRLVNAPIGMGGADGCPARLAEGEYELPSYITHISRAEPARVAGWQDGGLFTPNDIATVYSFDIPQERAGANCTLEFLFPCRTQLKTPHFKYEGPGNFFFQGYAPGVCPGAQVSFQNQPPIFPHAFPVHMEPGYAYTIEGGPCALAAGGCIGGVVSTPDTSFSYKQDVDVCPIGFFVSYEY